MSKTSKNTPCETQGVLDACENRRDEPHSIDIFTNTIMTLRKRVFQLEQELVQIQHFAYHDELTGLPNRSLLKDRLNQALKHANRKKTQVGLLLLDLDGFKHINDTLGHCAGDKLLTQVAQRLLSCIRDADSVYRYGGDEFVVLLPEVDGKKGTTELMWKLHSHLASPYSVNNHDLIVTASIGIAVYPADGVTHKDLVGCADISMYQAKNDKSSSHPLQ